MSIAGGHLRQRSATDEWLTPPRIVGALGPFDLDPCAPIVRPWNTAAAHYTLLDDGLMQEWCGRVWLNPPYGKLTNRWVERLALHGNGIAFVPARTETRWFFNHIWPIAHAILFLKGRVAFFDAAGRHAPHNANFPCALIAYGASNARALTSSGIVGKYIELREVA